MLNTGEKSMANHGYLSDLFKWLNHEKWWFNHQKKEGCDGNIRGISWGRNGIQVTAWDCQGCV